MKHQQVVVDYIYMLKTSFSFLCLAFAGWMLFKLVSACFWLPGWLKENEKLSQTMKEGYKQLAKEQPEAMGDDVARPLDPIEEEQKKEK